MLMRPLAAKAVKMANVPREQTLSSCRLLLGLRVLTLRALVAEVQAEQDLFAALVVAEERAVDSALKIQVVKEVVKVAEEAE